MVFKGICFILFFTTMNSLTAQHYKHLSQEEKEEKSIALIDEAEAFVLCTPIDSECFYGDDGKTIYTKIKIKVKHWYKGEGNRIIYLVRKGGVIGIDNQIVRHRASPSFHLDKDYFMLLNKEGEKYRFAKNIKASIGKYSDILSNDYHIKAFFDMKFDSVEVFNDFVKNLKNIKVPNKKKDAGFQEPSNEAPPMIDNEWLAGLGQLHAGVGEILTIKGENFGTKGDVLFVNANIPDEMMPKLEDEYIVEWTPNQIQVIIPSRVLEGLPSDDPGTAGSGIIKVKRTSSLINESTESTTPINIEYALTNLGFIGDFNYDVSQMYWAREHCLNGYVFTLHESFMGNDDAINAVEAALSAWANELGITLELEKVMDGVNEVYYFHNSTDVPRRNLIRFDLELDDDLWMQTRISGRRDTYDSDPSPDKYWLRRTEIRIEKGLLPNSNDVWDYTLSGDIDYAFGQDFYHLILHEIGHAIGLDHSIELEAGTANEKNLMYQFPRVGSAMSNDRTNLNQHGNGAKLGAQRIATDSRAHTWTGEFSDENGVETLAASGVNSAVQPTPTITATPLYSRLNGYTVVEFTPKPFNPLYNYYYWPWNSRFKWTCGDIGPSTHAVRIKDEACTVSSLYSLPVTIGGRGYCGRSREDSDEPVIEPLMTIYPNPTKSHIEIQFKSTEDEEIPTRTETYIGIYDNLGRLQKEHRVSDATLRQTTIDISTLPADMYWVAWFVDGEVIDTQQLQKTD